MILAYLAFGGELIVGAAGQDRGRFFVGDLGLGGRAGELVITLDEQPLLLLLSGRGRMRTRCQRPFSRCPSSEKSRWPLA